MNNQQNQQIITTLLFITFVTLVLSLLFQFINFQAIFEGLAYQSLAALTIFGIQELILIIPVVYYLKTKKISFEDFKLKKFNLAKAFKLIFLGFALFFTLNYLIINFSETFNISIPGYGTQEDKVGIFGQDPLSIPIALIILVFIVPVVEELLFRGFIYNKLRDNYTAKKSIIVSAAIFAGFHLELEVFIPLFILGCIIGFIYEKSDSLWVPILFHIINNSIAFAAAFYLV